MKKLEFYTGTKTYMYPNMSVAEPQRIESDFDAVNHFKCVVETDEGGEVFYAIEPYSAIRGRLGVAQQDTDEATLALMEEVINTVPEQVVSAEERIAAMLEYQVLSSL